MHDLLSRGSGFPFSPSSEVMGVVRDVRSLFLNKVDDSYIYLPLSQSRQWTSTMSKSRSCDLLSRCPSLLPLFLSAELRSTRNVRNAGVNPNTTPVSRE